MLRSQRPRQNAKWWTIGTTLWVGLPNGLRSYHTWKHSSKYAFLLSDKLQRVWWTRKPINEWTWIPRTVYSWYLQWWRSQGKSHKRKDVKPYEKTKEQKASTKTHSWWNFLSIKEYIPVDWASSSTSREHQSGIKSLRDRSVKSKCDRALRRNHWATWLIIDWRDQCHTNQRRKQRWPQTLLLQIPRLQQNIWEVYKHRRSHI